MSISEDLLLKQKRKLERRLKRNSEKLSELEKNKDKLSKHGHWSLGYFTGIVNELENQLDDINELLDSE